ncbi:MAG TPA: hypothetical protein VG347_02665 [Verrucomicrobiae bacterium]|nr:hypothetical protein [Verrucomicrobiae bacterium]
MKPDSKSKTRKPLKLASLLGLTLDGSRLEGVVLKRTNGSLAVLQSFSAQLTLDPLTAAPELVGREIRNHLDAAGVRERNCIVGVPLRWVLTAQTELPPLPAADAASLLQMESERSFHTDAAQLLVADSRSPLADDKKFVLLAAIPNTHLGSLEKVLGSAKLKPVSFGLGLTALQSPGGDKAEGVLALTIGEGAVGLQITAGGVAALRALEGAIETEGGRRSLMAGIVAREARVTLGQLPPELRKAVTRIRIFGPADLARQLADEMAAKFEPLGLKVEVVTAYGPNEFGTPLPPNVTLSPAFSLAARLLAGQTPVFEFLPPKPTLIEQFVAKYSSGPLRTTGAIAAAVVFLLICAFLIQQVQLWRLRSQWSHMSAKVADLQNIQDQIRFYRPWYDPTFRTLSILRQVTLAFPEDGAVTAKTIEIRDGGTTVSCSGNARDVGSLLAMQAKLRVLPGVSDVHLTQQRGKSPMQFTFDFKCGNGVTQ